MIYDNYMSAGRMINDINIDDIMYDIKRNVFDFISLCQFKTIVLDFDGTLTQFQYGDNSLLPCKDDELEEYSKNNNIYDNIKTLKLMKYAMNELNTNDVFILTVTVDSLKEKKEKLILKEFPTIKRKNIIQVSSTEEKNIILEELHKKYNKQIIFCDDTAKTLLNAEEKFDFVKGYHISSFLA